MAQAERRRLYTQIEETTGNPLIVYATSRRQNASGMIAADTIEEFTRQLERLDGQQEVLDILIESDGGDGLVVWRLMSAIRAKAKKIRALVPHSAFSAATLFCLGADEIIMGKYGCLGPTDPQISVMGKDGQQKFFAFEDVLAFIKFAEEKLNLRADSAKDIFNRFFDSIEPFSLGFASRSSDLSTSMGVKLLQSHSEKKIPSRRAQEISEHFNKKFFNHAHPLNKSEAKEIGLEIIEPEAALEDLMWEVHLDLDGEFKNSTPFDVLTNYFEKNNPIVPNVVQAPIGPEYEYKLKFAVLESVRGTQEYVAEYRTTVYRNPQTLAYGSVNVVTKQGWQRNT